jgi:hypothetical protein
MNNNFTLKWYFLRWIRGPINIIQGIAQTLTLGFFEPSWSLKAEAAFLDEFEV